MNRLSLHRFARLGASIGLASLMGFAGAAPDLFVCAVTHNQVLRYDGVTGAYKGVFASGGGLNFPNGLAWGVDSNLYVASAGNQVLRYNGATGAFIDVFATLDPNISISGVTLGPDDNLYCTSFAEDKVEKVDGRTGADLGAFASGGGLKEAYKCAFGPDENLYVASYGGGQVLKYNGATGAFMNVFAQYSGMYGPRALTFGPDQNLYVADYNASVVHRFNGTTGAFIDEFATNVNINRPAGIAFGLDSNLYLACVNTAQVLEFSGTTGAYLGIFAQDSLAFPNDILFGQVQRIIPATVSLFRGRLLSGGVASLDYVDGQALVAGAGPTLNTQEAPLQVIVQANGGSTPLSSLRFRVRARPNTPGIGQKVALFDYDANAWVTLSSQAVPTTYQSYEINAGTSPNRFVQPMTGVIKARLSYSQVGPTLSFPWVVNIDQTVWSTTQ